MSSRLHALDACRAAAMLWGLVFHAAISFMTIPIGWAIHDPAASRVADAFVWVSHSFRMPVFFLLAGFFARLLVERHGLAGFWKHRAKRILVPMVVALVPIMPAIGALWLWGRAKQPPAATHALGMPVGELDVWSLRLSPCHLWFLYYLMLLFTALVLFVALGRRLPLAGLLRAGDSVLGAALRFGGLPLLIALPAAAALWPMKGLEVETPVDFVPVPRILGFYAVFMALGWFLHRQKDRIPELGRRLWIPSIGALVLLPLLGGAVVRMVAGGDAGPRWPALLMSGGFTGCTVTLFLGLFVRFAERERAWISWLSDSAYWSYLLHLPVTVLLQVWVADQPWPGALKYLLVLSGTAAACLLTYRLFVRHTWLGEALNGRRIPRSA